MVNQISWMAVKTSRHQVIRAWVGRERKRQEKTHFKNETVGLSIVHVSPFWLFSFKDPSYDFGQVTSSV